MESCRMCVLCVCHIANYHPLVCASTLQYSLPFQSWFKLCDDGKKSVGYFTSAFVSFALEHERNELNRKQRKANWFRGSGQSWFTIQITKCIISAHEQFRVESIQLNALILVRKSFYLFTVFSFFRFGFGS